MRKHYRFLALLLIAGIFSIPAFSQNTISGNAKNAATKENIPAVSVLIKGNTGGTYTDDKGNFTITISQKLPVTLLFTSIGYADKEVLVTNASQSVDVVLDPILALAQEVIVSASRKSEKVLETPVTVDRVSASNIRSSAQASYYDIIGNLKGVDMVTSGLLFKTPSTRGFNSSGNYRLNQLVDGMDNQAPGLNFSVGTLVGVTELDVDNMELLGGASSALYGPGGMNGTLLINSKNPFKYQGLSWQVKQGINHIDRKQTSTSPYYDWTLRWAKQISEKFAFKIGGQFIQTRDWIATDYSNYNVGTNPATGKVIGGDRTTDPNYNGLNVYGDETNTNINLFLRAAGVPAFLLPKDSVVSRTGYKENEILDPTTLSVKLSGSVNYKITNNTEASLIGYWGYGNTVYTGSDRYSLKAVKIGQYKLEVRNPNWFLRAYTTQENAGESFNATVTARLFNEAWKPSYNPANAAGSWFPQYAGAYAQARIGGASELQAHNIARTAADAGRPKPGTAQFKSYFDQVSKTPISRGGGLFVDKSDLYMAEGQYNLTSVIKVAEVLIGGNFKQYLLNSGGTIFAEDILGGKIKINEFGGYAQISKSLINNIVKLTASGRFDKNDNFKGRFTPRVSAVIKAATNHSIRLSYQTAYRFPSTQQQYINLDIGGGVRLIGGLPFLRDYYNFNTNPVYEAASVGPDPTKWVRKNFDEFKPEEVKSYEVGYKGLIAKKLLIDVYGYYSEYTNFTGREVVIQSPGTANQKIFSVATNSTTKVNTQGWGASVEYLLPKNFSINANLFSDEIKNVPVNFVAFFNAPKYRANIGLNNSGLFWNKRLGFGITYHYQDAVYFQGDFASGTIPSFNTLDAQVSYKFPETKSVFKVGATNLANNYYRNAFANPQVGGLYYVSYGFNVY